MSYRKKLEDLGRHYGVSDPGGSNDKWAAAIKSKANAKFDTIDDLYERAFGKKQDSYKPIDKPVEVSARVDRIEDAKVELVPQHVNVDGARQSVDVKAPVLQFNLAPASVTINPGEVSWAYMVQQLGHKAFIFASGTMAGVLLAAALFKH